MLCDSSNFYKFFQDIDNLKMFFFLIFFFAISIFGSNISVSKAVERVTISETEMGFSLTSFYLLKKIFLEAVYFFFLIRHCNIHMTGFFIDFLAENWSVQVVKTPILSINMSGKIYSTFLSEK